MTKLKLKFSSKLAVNHQACMNYLKYFRLQVACCPLVMVFVEIDKLKANNVSKLNKDYISGALFTLSLSILNEYYSY